MGWSELVGLAILDRVLATPCVDVRALVSGFVGFGGVAHLRFPLFCLGGGGFDAFLCP